MHTAKIYRYYNNPAIAAGYARQEYITACERLIFNSYIKPGMAILDIGVGGGRTSNYLAVKASRYVGIDYAPEMIRRCRRKFPQWEYLQASATDLSPFQNGSFDVVLLSYNMLDDLIPDESRWRCLKECHRVLHENGLLIFSSHNPRAVFVRAASENSKPHLHAQAERSTLLDKALNWSVRRFTSMLASIRRAFDYGTKLPFWRGEGYMLDSENLMTHFWTPRRAIAELSRYGFRFIALQGDDYPMRSRMLFTDWYYYVFQR
jgi:ubiquinone/menaquinone biosynthesis C-methylase UbiE